MLQRGRDLARESGLTSHSALVTPLKQYEESAFGFRGVEHYAAAIGQCRARLSLPTEA